MNKKDLDKLGLTAEAIEKAGLDDDVLDKIIVLHGKSTEAKKSEIETLQTKVEGLENQLSEANETIDGFKDLDIDGVKKSAEDWKAKAVDWEAKAQQAEKDAADQVKKIEFDHALQAALTEAKVKDPKDVIPHLKMDTIQLGDDGKFIGLTEQLDPLMEAKEYLFESDDPNIRIVDKSKNKSVVGDSIVRAAREAAGLSDETGDT